MFENRIEESTAKHILSPNPSQLKDHTRPD